jgi:hypothetical protein
MNTRTAAITLAFAALNIAAVAVQSGGTPTPFDPNNLFVASGDDTTVTEFDHFGNPVHSVSGVSDLPANISGLLMPEDIDFGPGGLLFVADGGSDTIKAFDADGDLIDTLGPVAGLDHPTGMAFGREGDLFVASSEADQVVVFDRNGTATGTIGGPSTLDDPWGVALGPGGRLYVSSRGANQIVAFDPGGTKLFDFGASSGMVDPHGVLWRAGRIFVASYGTDEVLMMDNHGNVLNTIGGAASSLRGPVDMVFGADGLLYVSSNLTDEVVVFDVNGNEMGVIGSSASLRGPTGLDFSPFVFHASLEGTLEREGKKRVKVKQAALLTLRPGSDRVTVRMVPPLGPLVSIYGSDTWVLYGRATATSPVAKEQIWAGEEVSELSSHDGLLSMRLELKGSIPKDVAKSGIPAIGGSFTVKKAQGVFQRSAPGQMVSGKIKSGKLINPKKK